MSRWNWDYKEPNDWNHDRALVQKVVDHELRDYKEDPPSGIGSPDTPNNFLLRRLDVYASRVPKLVAEHEEKDEVFTATAFLVDARENFVNDRLKALARDITSRWPTGNRPLIGDEDRAEPYSVSYAAKKLTKYYENEFMECFWGTVYELKSLPRGGSNRRRPKDWNIGIDIKLAKMAQRLASSLLSKMVEEYGRDLLNDEIRKLFWATKAGQPTPALPPIQSFATSMENVLDGPAPKRRKSSVGPNPMLHAAGSLPRSTSTSAIPSTPSASVHGGTQKLLSTSEIPGTPQAHSTSYIGDHHAMGRRRFNSHGSSRHGASTASSTQIHGYRSYTEDPYDAFPARSTSSAEMPMHHIPVSPPTADRSSRSIAVETPDFVLRGENSQQIMHDSVRKFSGLLPSVHRFTSLSNPGIAKPLQGGVPLGIVQEKQAAEAKKNPILERKLTNVTADQAKPSNTRVSKLAMDSLSAKMSELPSPTRLKFYNLEEDSYKDCS